MSKGAASVLLAAALVSCFLIAPVSAASKGKRKGVGHSAVDKDLKIKRQECEAEVHKYLPSHERENLILECISGQCYANIYGKDPIEEGEIDSTRARDYRSCCRAEQKDAKARAKAEERARSIS